MARVSKQKLYFKGSVLVVGLKTEMPKEIRTYMLVESLQKGIVFDLICISGYKAGTVYCLIKEDPIASMLNCRAVTEQHVKDELIRNYGGYYKTTFKIYTQEEYQKMLKNK